MSKSCVMALLVSILVAAVLSTPVSGHIFSRLLRYLRPAPKTIPEAINTLQSYQNPTLAESLKAVHVAETSGGKATDFLGVPNARTLKIASSVCKKCAYTVDEALKVMESPYAEVRVLGIDLLRHRFEEAGKVAQSSEGPEAIKAQALREKVVKEFVRRIPTYMNNWNLVDLGASSILGGYVTTNKDEVSLLYKLAKSENVWERRAALMGTVKLIQLHEMKDFEAIAQMLLSSPQLVIKKAIGILLQMIAQQDEKFVVGFLESHLPDVPTKTMRDAISEMSPRAKARFSAILAERQNRGKYMLRYILKQRERERNMKNSIDSDEAE